LGLTRGLARNLVDSNIYTYAIAPGIVRTTMSDQQDDQRQQDTISKTINKRMCTPEEIANLTLFLVQKEQGYMNGSVLHMNNGLHMN